MINGFIPAAQIKDVQIGPLLGDMLVEKHVVSADALALALSQQAALRNGRVGTYLADRAIISSEELTLALQAQEKRPNVRLGEILIEAKLITFEQLEEALMIQAGQRGRRIGEIWVEMGAVSMRLIQFAMSDKLGIPMSMYVSSRLVWVHSRRSTWHSQSGIRRCRCCASVEPWWLRSKIPWVSISPRSCGSTPAGL